MVEIEGGINSIGSDEGLRNDEALRHDVELAPFALGQFPVANAELNVLSMRAVITMNAGGHAAGATLAAG
jgi:formylglycine-generating enzyme required for sulfatase activity